MSREDRLYRLQQLLRIRRSISMAQIMSELEVKRATVRRYLDYLRDTYGVPVQWDRSIRGYRIERGEGDQNDIGLPGLWFNASELHALLTMDQLLQTIEPGILRSHIEPLRAKLHKILGVGDHSLEEIERRVRVLPMTARPVDPKYFEVTVTALLNRRRLHVVYLSRSTGEESKRYLSPQRLVHYRDNWYLDAWCHQKHGLRMFSVDAIRSAKMVDELARDVPERDLRAVLESGYGIFSGRRTKTARLRFTPVRARWVATESWHPRQKGWWDKKGNYVLEFPYSNHPELLMDILRHIPEIEVMAPRSLHNLLTQKIKEAAERYLNIAQQ